MTDRHEQTHSLPSNWFQRSAVSCVVGVGYLFSLFLVQRTLVSFLLLTGIYGVWLLIYQIGRRRMHLGWWQALFCLACASLFIPFPATTIYWLPILPTMTACLLLTTIKSRPLGLGLACALWLGTGFTLSFLTRQWGDQVILLISFSSACGCTATISELRATHRQMQEYSAQIEELSIIRERNRLAREIHDTLGHTLTLLSVQLETATQLEARDDSRLHEKLLEARRVAKACLADVRHSVEALRPDETSSRSLPEQLQRLAKEFETTCDETSITLDIEEATHPLNAEQCQALYRCAQEALTNIRKYAHATKVLLRLSTSGGRDGMVELTVLDNGLGGSSQHEQNTSGFGLVGMCERITLLDGTLRAGPELGHGWRVEVVLPLKQQDRRIPLPCVWV